MGIVFIADLIFIATVFLGLIFLLRGWKRAFRQDVKLVLAGLLIIIFTHGIIRFFEWSYLNLQGLDPFSDFLATLVPVVWVFFFYTFLQQISDQRKEHLNSILRSINEINQLLIKVGDRGRLVSEICEKLVKTRGYEHVWAILFDQKGEIELANQEGLGDEFDQLVDQIREGKFPTCVEQPMGGSSLTVIENPHETCSDCPLWASFSGNGVVVMRLEYGESFYGLLSASAPPRVIKSAKEKELFEELAGDIAFGLHDMEVEESLRRSERKFRSYVENAPEGVFLADEHGNYIEVNEAGCKMTGYSEKELLEMSISDIPSPDKKEEAREAFKVLKEEGEVRTELPYLRKDGSTGYMAVNAVRLASDRFLAFTEDITEKTEAYKQLKQSRRRFKDMADLLPLPIWEADSEGSITYLNRAGLEKFGYSESALEEGISVGEFVAAEDRERAIENFEKVLRGRELKNTEYTLVRKDETRFSALSFSSPIVREGETQGVRGIILDITKRKETQRKLEKATIGTLQALNRTIEAKDEYTGEHIDRVQEYSVRVGREMGLSDSRVEQLRYASILHDIGKIGVPDSILGKPEELTEEEWNQMEKHPKIGERIVRQVEQLERAAEIIGQHQEHFDGNGYPRGLKEDEITLEARIITVVDAWDAMRTDRPYRQALSRERAIEELKENAGSQFDPEIVEVFLNLLETEGELV